MKKIRNYWTKEKCEEEAIKYDNREDFREKSRYAYVVSFKNGWLDDICSHMVLTKTPKGFWTKEKCKEKASKCSSRSEFRDKFKSAYIACLRNDWLDEVCFNLKGYKPHGFWTKENCHKEALKYKTRTEFQKNSRWAYVTALKNDWMNDICQHMKIIGNLYKRCVYAYEFKDNFVYVGLTYDIDKRLEKHLLKGPVFKHMKIEPNYSLLQLSNYVDIEEAKKLEDKFVKEYKNKGWNVLNLIKTGGIGGSKFWTKEKCLTVAKKYKTRADFNKTTAAIAARRYGWLEEINKTLEQTTKPFGFWTKENCHKEALKYKTKIEFFEGSPGVYNIARKKGWLDEICSHMIKKYRKIKK